MANIVDEWLERSFWRARSRLDSISEQQDFFSRVTLGRC